MHLAPAAETDFRSYGHDIRKRLMRAVRKPAKDPRPTGTTKLKGIDEVWRLGVGGIRILYAVLEDLVVVIVLRIGDRTTVYDRLQDLI